MNEVNKPVVINVNLGERVWVHYKDAIREGIYKKLTVETSNICGNGRDSFFTIDFGKFGEATFNEYAKFYLTVDDAIKCENQIKMHRIEGEDFTKKYLKGEKLYCAELGFDGWVWISTKSEKRSIIPSIRSCSIEYVADNIKPKVKFFDRDNKEFVPDNRWYQSKEQCDAANTPTIIGYDGECRSKKHEQISVMLSTEQYEKVKRLGII